jgi:hypothetical protein
MASARMRADFCGGIFTAETAKPAEDIRILALNYYFG